MKRILDCKASDFLTFNRHDLLASIQKAEGRTVLAEVIPTVQPLYPEVTNAELARAFGADMILLNMLDVFHPYIKGLESHALFGNVPGESMSDNPILELKRLVGLPIGVNLEPVDFSEKSTDMYDVKQGRLATREAFAKASELGIDFICLTGNPNTGVTNEAIEQAIISARQAFAGVIIAGKMHQAGVGRVLDREAYTRFAEAGADIILIPAPGTVPGVVRTSFSKSPAIFKRSISSSSPLSGLRKKEPTRRRFGKSPCPRNVAGRTCFTSGTLDCLGLPHRKIFKRYRLPSAADVIRTSVWPPRSTAKKGTEPHGFVPFCVHQSLTSRRGFAGVVVPCRSRRSVSTSSSETPFAASKTSK